METQKLFFQQLKQALPDHLSLVDKISEMLNVSNDSAYRRIRGEKALPLGELQQLSKEFGISIDTLFNLESGNVVFNNVSVGPDGIDLKEWLKRILANTTRVHAAKEKEIIYSAKDPPLFHYFQVPELAAFKVFFWQKTLLSFPEFADRKFSLEKADKEIQELGEQLLAKYINIPTIEIWNEDTFSIAFSQMEYYWVSGLFENKEDVYILCDAFHKWVSHIQEQAELGFKFLYGQEPDGIEDSFKLYLNEVVLNDNSILVKMDEAIMTFLTYNVVSLVVTTDPEFGFLKEKFLRRLCQNSNLISHANAKERNKFFNKLFKKIEDFKASIE